MADSETNVVAPMVGKVVNILVHEGDEVEENQPVITLEAMKIEMPVVAPAAGTVKQIPVSVGDVVEADTVLVVLE
jgi:biotin carboxyl carrier protein